MSLGEVAGVIASPRVTFFARLSRRSGNCKVFRKICLRSICSNTALCTMHICRRKSMASQPLATFRNDSIENCRVFSFRSFWVKWDKRYVRGNRAAAAQEENYAIVRCTFAISDNADSQNYVLSFRIFHAPRNDERSIYITKGKFGKPLAARIHQSDCSTYVARKSERSHLRDFE